MVQQYEGNEESIASQQTHFNLLSHYITLKICTETDFKNCHIQFISTFLLKSKKPNFILHYITATLNILSKTSPKAYHIRYCQLFYIHWKVTIIHFQNTTETEITVILVHTQYFSSTTLPTQTSECECTEHLFHNTAYSKYEVPSEMI
jgi:hypothetical protein